MSSFMPVVNPNLPTAAVNHVVVSGEYVQFIDELERCGITVLTTSACDDILPAVRYHADMVFSYLGNGRYIAEKSQIILKSKLNQLGFSSVQSDISLGEAYPCDIKLNSCIIANRIISGKKNAFNAYFNDSKIITVSQGYAKCSICVVDENSIITDDESICTACSDADMDVLLVRKGCVLLNGFDYGFIGGCCGKISDDTIAFCGDITTHTDYNKIKSFLSERNVYTLSLGKCDLTDIGSILPITQHI